MGLEEWPSDSKEEERPWPAARSCIQFWLSGFYSTLSRTFFKKDWPCQGLFVQILCPCTGLEEWKKGTLTDRRPCTKLSRAFTTGVMLWTLLFFYGIKWHKKILTCFFAESFYIHLYFLHHAEYGGNFHKNSFNRFFISLFQNLYWKMPYARNKIRIKGAIFMFKFQISRSGYSN